MNMMNLYLILFFIFILFDVIILTTCITNTWSTLRKKYLNFYGTEKYDVNKKETTSTRLKILKTKDTAVHLHSVK